MATAGAATGACIWPRATLEGRSEAFLAGGLVLVGDKDDVVSVFAGEPLDLTVPDLTNTLATLLAQSFAGGDDVDRNLGDVGGVLSDSGLD